MSEKRCKLCNKPYEHHYSLFGRGCLENIYVVYTDNSKDEFGNVRVFASIYKMTDKGGELLPIKTDREWKVIETILETIQEENKKDGV